MCVCVCVHACAWSNLSRGGYVSSPAEAVHLTVVKPEKEVDSSDDEESEPSSGDDEEEGNEEEDDDDDDDDDDDGGDDDDD